MSEIKEKKTFLDFLLLLTKWRKSIFINLLLVGIIALIISFQLPKWYKATAVVMPPSENQAGGGLSALMNSLPIGGLGLGIGGGGEMTYMAILKSKSFATDVIKKFDLQNFYEKETMFETYLSFYSDYDVMLTEENMISITFEYTDSNKVAEIVNYIVDRLGVVSNNLVLDRSEKQFKMIEKRYFQNLKDIDSLQVELEIFQKKYGVIEFYEQTRAIISAVAELEAQIIVKKAELEAIKENFGESSPQYTSVKIQIETFEKQINKLKYANKEYLDNPFSSMFIPLEKIPKLSKEYTDIYMNLLLQQKLQEYLLPEYEQTKMRLLKKQPSLQVIDYAIPPDYKSAPKKAFIILGALVVAFSLHLFIILLSEKTRQIKLTEPDKYEKVKYILAAISFKSK